LEILVKESYFQSLEASEKRRRSWLCGCLDMLPGRTRNVAIGVLLGLFIPVWAAAMQTARPGSPADITISAAISMKDTLAEIVNAYHADHPEVKVRFNFGASGTLEQQIEQGAPVDIFISASPDQMNALESKGLILSGTRRDLVRNKLVLIVPKGKSGVSSFEDLTRPYVRFIAVGEPQAVPAGKYAQEVLTHFGLYEQLKPKFVLAKDVREVLTYVATDNADAGIVYITDALTTKDVTIVATAPENSHSPVVYPMAMVKTSVDPGPVRALMEFILGSKARAVFEKYGFVPAGM
jgi:molybdate transport system substrate-binding protein